MCFRRTMAVSPRRSKCHNRDAVERFERLNDFGYVASSSDEMTWLAQSRRHAPAWRLAVSRKKP